MPEGGGTDGGGTGIPGPLRATGGGCEAEGGALPIGVGIGAGAIPAPPIFCRRDLRSIFGFFSSAIVPARTYVPGHLRVNATEPSRPPFSGLAGGVLGG